MKTTFFFLFLICFSCSCSKNNKSIDQIRSFPNQEYTAVLAYKMDGTNTNLVTQNNNISPHRIGKGNKLSSDQVGQLRSIFNNPDNFGGDGLRCFQPHLGFVFYDASSKVVAHITICFECNRFRTQPDLGIHSLSEKGFRDLIKLEENIFN